jgi:hypothetical protein
MVQPNFEVINRGFTNVVQDVSPQGPNIISGAPQDSEIGDTAQGAMSNNQLPEQQPMQMLQIPLEEAEWNQLTSRQQIELNQLRLDQQIMWDELASQLHIEQEQLARWLYNMRDSRQSQLCIELNRLDNEFRMQLIRLEHEYKIERNRMERQHLTEWYNLEHQHNVEVSQLCQHNFEMSQERISARQYMFDSPATYEHESGSNQGEAMMFPEVYRSEPGFD